jgi:hypothetical protein
LRLRFATPSSTEASLAMPTGGHGGFAAGAV